ncbi:MAG: hypothetical protein WC387_01410 [Candidatus Paceibacterota bacterium]|jgi:uncharacterized coiled-coil protein SlyX
MTVGESIYKQAVENGYNPTFAEGLISPLNNAVEEYQKVFEHMREPLKNISSVIESVRPQMEAVARMSIPSISQITMPKYPETLGGEDSYFMPTLTRPVQEVRIVNPEDIAVASAKHTSEYVIASYLLPQNATWESLGIQFIDGHFVKVSYPKMKSKKFDFKDMGFINTKTNRPDRKWELLREMADNGGALTNEKWNRRFSRNVKYDLNERLKKFFGMKENPIPHYTKKNGYRARFTLRGDK